MATYETSLKTREALINAAGELAAEMGFASVSLRAIAERAQVNIGGIHYHFGAKEKLFAAVVRAAARVWKDNPVIDLLSRLDLATPQGQARAIRAIVHRNILLLFDRDMPSWHCRVLFQVMQTRGPLREIFTNEIIKPDHAAIHALFNRIDSTIDSKEAFLRILIMNTPVFIHGDHQDFIQEFLENDHYPNGYLQKMEDIIVRQTQLLLGLPSC